MKLIVTGSSSGIGRFLVKYLCKEGHSLWGIARSDQSALAQEIKNNDKGSFRFSSCDISSWESLSRLAEEIKESWQTFNGLLCLSGSQGPLGPAMSIDPITWQETVHANLNGVFFAIRALYPLLDLKGSNHSKIICMSGGGATSCRPNFSAYAAAKTAIVRLVEILAEEWKGNPIDINSIAPGAIYTRMTEEVIALGPKIVGEKEYASALKTRASAQTLEDPSKSPLYQVSGLIQFLLSSQSDGISGRLIAAQWDPWNEFEQRASEIMKSDIYTLRRTLPF